MASHVVVIATDLRRKTIKVSPGTYLIDVLEQACKELNLASDRYLIKNKQKQVDLSVPFRTSGLLPGAKLELVLKSNTPSAVQVALQLPHPDAKEIPGGRLIRKFPSDLSLWKVLRQFESGEASAGKNVNITARGVADNITSGGGHLFYETPVLNIMGREFATFREFQKTLSQLGYNSGNVLVRLSYRKTDQIMLEAMDQISHLFKDIEEQDQKAENATAETTVEEFEPERLEDAPMTDGNHDCAKDSETHQRAPLQDKLEDESTGKTEEATGERPPGGSSSLAPIDPYLPVSVFLAPTGPVPAAALAPSESDSEFVPSIAHAQLHQARLQQSSRNKRLPSDRELEEKIAAEEARLAAIKSVVIKVRFPDNTSSEWQVGPEATGTFLYEAVRRVMASREHPFRLVLPGSKTAIQDNSSSQHGLIRSYKLSGRVLVNLVWDDSVPKQARQKPFLSESVAQLGKVVKIPEMPRTAEDDQPAPVQQQPRADRGKGAGEDGAKKVPKWFKIGKK
ncbi:UBX domain protein [Drechmeria coniospora]|uniref:UBX domain protein n=1 Tax=Drechmeria coniospora TaxID=98403 RepID=A0A151GE73_DRECN|nr:UBX domain protein [Drechmeria coniospora]KYK55397.1 UBX domain protein [Drechmeria coniospora]ODA81998.1 hypothetical protein RJ55_00503 [Drechmeria coniospora]